MSTKPERICRRCKHSRYDKSVTGAVVLYCHEKKCACDYYQKACNKFAKYTPEEIYN